MNRPDDFYTNEETFLGEVIDAKRMNGSITNTWVAAATSVWPAATAILISRAAGAVAAGAGGISSGLAGIALGSMLFPFGAIVGAGLGLYAARTLLSKNKEKDQTAKVAEASSRLRDARRVFLDLQLVRETEPGAVREEIDQLFNELVEDRGIVG